MENKACWTRLGGRKRRTYSDKGWSFGNCFSYRRQKAAASKRKDLVMVPPTFGEDTVFDLPSSDKIIVTPQREVINANEDLIPPGHEPSVSDIETGLGMTSPWKPRFNQE